ncbi:hypothetical protein [Moorena sp. SIO4G3]|uniref:hypothetical protein n=1 Tax=Moorena sp. SIO4G3 TaxID=2607821 RepID=UPI00142B2DCF|nr:hypothetical protein [Moorena sp. SIO4G3]NEO79165.1 hypothetical protein [Moorena sp. SIO4G3]
MILFIFNYWSGIDQQRDRIIMIWRRYGVGWAVLTFKRDGQVLNCYEALPTIGLILSSF